jgi:hypothetical protein
VLLLQRNYNCVFFCCVSAKCRFWHIYMINPYQKICVLPTTFLFAKATTFRWINIFMKRHMTRDFIVARGSLYSILTAAKSLSCVPIFFTHCGPPTCCHHYSGTQIFALRNDRMFKIWIARRPPLNSSPRRAINAQSKCASLIVVSEYPVVNTKKKTWLDSWSGGGGGDNSAHYF